MTKDQAKAFLTKADLENLQRKIEAGKLQIQVEDQNPTVDVRGTAVPFFIILELIGSL